MTKQTAGGTCAPESSILSRRNPLESRVSSSAHIARASSKLDAEVMPTLQPLAPHLSGESRTQVALFLVPHLPLSGVIPYGRSTTKCRPPTQLFTPYSYEAHDPHFNLDSLIDQLCANINNAETGPHIHRCRRRGALPYLDRGLRAVRNDAEGACS
jgi:hypothetical protein